VRPGGRRISVLGTTATTKTGQDVVVIAYRGNGSRIWRHRFEGPTSGDDSASSGTLGSKGRHIDLTGGSDHDYLSLAYRRNGGQLWSGRYDGPAGGEDFATEASVAPDNRSLFVIGQSQGATTEDVATPSYTSAGDRRWVARYDSSGTDSPGSIAISPDGTFVVVTGEERDVYWFAGTIAYVTR
jgi:hypothetical protein